jgi:hypothetical protein
VSAQDVQQVLVRLLLTPQDQRRVLQLTLLPICDRFYYRIRHLHLSSLAQLSLRQPFLLASQPLRLQITLHLGMLQSNVAQLAVRLWMKRSLRTRPSLLT